MAAERQSRIQQLSPQIRALVPDDQASAATNAAKDAAKNLEIEKQRIEEQRSLQESAAQKGAIIGAMAPPEGQVPEAGATSQSPSTNDAIASAEGEAPEAESTSPSPSPTPQ